MSPTGAVERVEGAQFVPPWVRREHQARYDFAARFVPGQVVVDCACGDGAGTAVFAQHGPRCIWAFDVLPEAVRTAQGRSMGDGVRLAAADSLRLPLPDDVADVYVALETIEHLEDDRAFLREVVRVLDAEGVFVCSTPNRTVTNPGRTLADRPWNVFHVREYTRDEFVGLLEERFAQVQVWGQNPQHGWKVRVMERIGRLGPGHLAVRVNQALKLSGLFLDRPGRHAVQETRPSDTFEYLVAVCREPLGRRG